MASMLGPAWTESTIGRAHFAARRANLGASIGAAIWLAYWLRSRRVRSTLAAGQRIEPGAAPGDDERVGDIVTST